MRLLFVLILGASVSIVTAAKAVLASGWIMVVVVTWVWSVFDPLYIGACSCVYFE